MQIKHELGDGDFDRRIQFCEIMITFIAQNEHYFKKSLL